MSATIPDTMLLEEITKATGYDCPEDLQGVTFKEATSGPGGGMSASEINEMVTRLIAGKQDKKIVFENQEMLLTEALQKVNAVANGKAQIFEASELPAKPAPNSQYWVKTYNGQTLDNGRYIILVDSLGAAHLVGKSVDSPSVNDVQINGTSIVDGATKTANIRPKTTIDSTATEKDIPSAKGVWDLVSNYYTIAQANDTFIQKPSIKTVIDDTATDTDVISGKAVFDFYKDTKIEDVTSKIRKSTTFTTVSFNAIKIGEHFLYLKFQLTKSGTLNAGSDIVLTLSNLEKVGIRNTESVAGSLYVSAGTASTFYNKNAKSVYIYTYQQMNNPSMHFSYLIPINL